MFKGSYLDIKYVRKAITFLSCLGPHVVSRLCLIIRVHVYNIVISNSCFRIFTTYVYDCICPERRHCHNKAPLHPSQRYRYFSLDDIWEIFLHKLYLKQLHSEVIKQTKLYSVSKSWILPIRALIEQRRDRLGMKYVLQ